MEAASVGIGGGSLSIEEFERLPQDGYRHDLVRGMLVREPPAGFHHGELAADIGWHITGFVRRHDLGHVVAAETGFVLAEEPPTVRGPDFAFVARGRLTGEAPRGFARLAPDLAVEVVSPCNSWSDVAAKVRDYLDGGTLLVWIVDPRGQSATVHQPGANPEVIGVDGELDGADVLPGFRLRLEMLFRR